MGALAAECRKVRHEIIVHHVGTKSIEGNNQKSNIFIHERSHNKLLRRLPNVMIWDRAITEFMEEVSWGN